VIAASGPFRIHLDDGKTKKTMVLDSEYYDELDFFCDYFCDYDVLRVHARRND
jgi:hypothetical protein